MELLEATRGDCAEQRGELVLPLRAVAQDGVLERRAVKQHKLDVQYGLLGLYVVGDLVVSTTRGPK